MVWKIHCKWNLNLHGTYRWTKWSFSAVSFTLFSSVQRRQEEAWQLALAGLKLDLMDFILNMPPGSSVANRAGSGWLLIRASTWMSFRCEPGSRHPQATCSTQANSHWCQWRPIWSSGSHWLFVDKWGLRWFLAVRERMFADTSRNCTLVLAANLAWGFEGPCRPQLVRGL